MKFILITLASILLLSCSTTKKIKVIHEMPVLLNGQMMPSASIQTVGGQTFNSSLISKSAPTVLIIYRGGWCPYCMRQLSGLANIKMEIKKLGYQIVAISPDSPKALKESIGKHKIDFKLYSDSKLKLATAMGLSFKVDNDTLKRYKEWKIDLVAASGETHQSLPIPAVYVLDRDGLVHFNYINPNYKVRLNEQILLSALKELALD